MHVGSLESKIGFKWRDEVTDTACAITGEIFKSNIGFNPIIMNTAGNKSINNQFINANLLSKYAASTYIEWRGLCVKSGNKIKPEEDFVLSKNQFKMPSDAIELVLIFREACKNITKHSTGLTIDSEVIVKEIAQYGFAVKKSITGKNFAEEAVRKILDPMLMKKHRKAGKIIIQ